MNGKNCEWKLQCLIVDDEAPARDELRFMLGELSDVKVVGSAATAEEALVLIDNVNYDVIFLDIHMPGSGGLALAEQLSSRKTPEVIFVSAYPNHAVVAFELAAVDYLLKPLDAGRLKQAIGRVTAKLRPNIAENSVQPERYTTVPVGGALPKPVRLPVQTDNAILLLEASDVIAASAARGYSTMVLERGCVFTNYNLTEIEEYFQSSLVRVHRSHIANLNRVAELKTAYNGGLVLVMNDQSQTLIPVSRRHTSDLRRHLGIK